LTCVKKWWYMWHIIQIIYELFNLLKNL
jgi:hypothetical protein